MIIGIHFRGVFLPLESVDGDPGNDGMQCARSPEQAKVSFTLLDLMGEMSERYIPAFRTGGGFCKSRVAD